MNPTLVGSLAAGVVASSAAASITTFLDDQNGWSALAGMSTEIDFVSPYGGSSWFIPADHYASLGIQLSTKNVPGSGPAQWYGELSSPFGDHWEGFTGAGYANDAPAVNFISPRHGFAYSQVAGAMDPVSIGFYLQGNLLASSTIVAQPGTPYGLHFYGWATSFDFDRVVLAGDYGMDSVYITAIPAPSGVWIVAIAMARGRRRRA